MRALQIILPGSCVLATGFWRLGTGNYERQSDRVSRHQKQAASDQPPETTGPPF